MGRIRNENAPPALLAARVLGRSDHQQARQLALCARRRRQADRVKTGDAGHQPLNVVDQLQRALDGLLGL